MADIEGLKEAAGIGAEIEFAGKRWTLGRYTNRELIALDNMGALGAPGAGAVGLEIAMMRILVMLRKTEPALEMDGLLEMVDLHDVSTWSLLREQVDAAGFAPLQPPGEGDSPNAPAPAAKAPRARGRDALPS